MKPTNRPRAGRVNALLGWMAVVPLLAVAPAAAQSPGNSSLLTGGNPAASTRGGFHLYNVSGFAGWESSANPYGSSFLLPNSTLQSDEMFGGAASVGWSYRGERSNVSLTYTASYIGRYRYSQWNSLNHFVSLSASRRLTPKWTMSLSGISMVSSYDQLLFTPTTFGSLAAVPSTFQDLAGAVLAGNMSNNQLASLLTGAPVIESPARTLFFGNRMWASSGSVNAGYAESSRLNVHFSTGVSEMQHLNDSSHQAGPQNVYLIPHATYGTAGLGLSYALSSHTQAGVEGSANRGFSQIENAYTSTGMAFISHTFGARWFTEARGGAGYIAIINSASPVGNRTAAAYGAKLGYRTLAHTLLAAYDHSPSLAYGVAAANVDSTSAAWHWQRPGHHWGLSSNYVRQQFHEAVFGHANGWRAMFGVTRQAGRHMMLETAYTYASYTGIYGAAPYNATQNAVHLTVMWVPEAIEGH
jgi:hypothetical protein